MNKKTQQSIKRRMGLIIPFSLLVLIVMGCAASQQEIRGKESLERASSAYLQAGADQNVQAYAKAQLADAGKILQAAEQTKDFKEMEQLGYLSEKKSQIALTTAEEKVKEKEIETLKKEAGEALMQKQVLEAQIARMEAEGKAREAEQSKLEAAKDAASAEKAKKEAMAKAQETEKARAEAEAKALEAEQSKLEAEKARKEAEARALETEKARAEVEAKALETEQSRLEAEKARKETEARALETEKARAEVEAKALETEQSRLEAEKARKEAEAKAREAEQTKAEVEQLLKDLAELQGKQTERGIVLTLGDVLFAFDKAELSAGAVRNADKLVQYLEKYPERNLLIEGHTDSVGRDEYNLTLSEKRADAVREMLVGKGVSPDRMVTKGYGKQFPVATNDTESGRQLNRRVEVVILNEGVNPEAVLR